MAMESIRASAAASISGRAAAASGSARPAPAAQATSDPANARAAPQVPRVTLHAAPAFDASEMRQHLEEVAKMLNEQLRSSNTNLAFGVDPVADRTVITVTNRGGEVVREIPGEVFLRVARNIERFIREGADSVAFKGIELDQFL